MSILTVDPVDIDAALAQPLPPYRPFYPPPPPRQGEPTGEPCVRCGGEGATHHWQLCRTCRRKLQQAANAAVKRLWELHPDRFSASPH